MVAVPLNMLQEHWNDSYYQDVYLYLAALPEAALPQLFWTHIYLNIAILKDNNFKVLPKLSEKKTDFNSGFWNTMFPSQRVYFSHATTFIILLTPLFNVSYALVLF